jgi:transposase
MKNKERKQYTAEFKAQAVELMATGKPASELADELCVSSNLLYNWRLKSQDALRLLRREVARFKEENLIFKKAAVILGTKIPPNSTL